MQSEGYMIKDVIKCLINTVMYKGEQNFIFLDREIFLLFCFDCQFNKENQQTINVIIQSSNN